VYAGGGGAGAAVVVAAGAGAVMVRVFSAQTSHSVVYVVNPGGQDVGVKLAELPVHVSVMV